MFKILSLFQHFVTSVLFICNSVSLSEVTLALNWSRSVMEKAFESSTSSFQNAQIYLSLTPSGWDHMGESLIAHSTCEFEFTKF